MTVIGIREGCARNRVIFPKWEIVLEFNVLIWEYPDEVDHEKQVACILGKVPRFAGGDRGVVRGGFACKVENACRYQEEVWKCQHCGGKSGGFQYLRQ
jgi:hypothetical protein